MAPPLFPSLALLGLVLFLFTLIRKMRPRIDRTDRIQRGQVRREILEILTRSGRGDDAS